MAPAPCPKCGYQQHQPRRSKGVIALVTLSFITAVVLVSQQTLSFRSSAAAATGKPAKAATAAELEAAGGEGDEPEALQPAQPKPADCGRFGLELKEEEVADSVGTWAAAQAPQSFRTPQSRCAVLHDGSVRLPAAHDADTAALPFLFDTASMANWSAACGHCTKREVVHCCGVCTFDRERCNSLYPRQDKPKAVADLLMRSGFAVQAFTPCELFQRIRGRTMWFMGDSQTWAFYYAAECFLREFAPSLRRTPAVAPEENQQLKIVSHISPPLCLNLARNTRVCGVRVDYASDVQKKVLPRLMKLVPNFKEDIVVLNTGLHYPEYDHPETPSPRYVQELTALAEWRQLHADFLPRIVWMDTGPQHFFTHEGTFPGHGKRPFKCRPLDAWYKGDPVVGAGTRRAMAVAPIVSRLADAHLQIYNATVPLWDSHLPGECSHWCQPSAYQLWLYLLNDVLRDSELGNAVRMPGSPAGDSRR